MAERGVEWDQWAVGSVLIYLFGVINISSAFIVCQENEVLTPDEHTNTRVYPHSQQGCGLRVKRGVTVYSSIFYLHRYTNLAPNVQDGGYFDFNFGLWEEPMLWSFLNSLWCAGANTVSLCRRLRCSNYGLKSSVKASCQTCFGVLRCLVVKMAPSCYWLMFTTQKRSKGIMTVSICTVQLF